MSAKAWSSGSASRRGAAGRERRRLQALQAAATCLWKHQETTIKVSLMVAGAQGGGYALGIWMPTYLRTVRGLSAPSTGGFLLVQILGALIGFLIGTYLSDAIGRKWTLFVVGNRHAGHGARLHV